MDVQSPAAMLAQADREVADLKERLGYLTRAYQVMRDGDPDGIRAGSWLLAKLNGSEFTRMQLSGLLSVAISMLAERPATHVLGRSVSCDRGCYGENKDFDCPIHGGMQGGGRDA